MTVPPVPLQTKLPVMHTVEAAYRQTFAHFDQLVRIAWVWLIVLALANAVLSALLWPVKAANELTPSDTGTGLLFSLPMLFNLLIGAAIAVPWHRLLLRGEQVHGPASLRYDTTVMRYVAGGLLLLLPFMLPAGILGLSMPAFDHIEQLEPSRIGLIFTIVGLSFVALFAGLYLSVRLSPILPAIALERTDVTLGSVWRRTRGNWWRLFFGGMVAIIPLFPVSILAGLLTPEPTSLVRFVAASVLTELTAIIFSMVSLSFLSMSFQHLFGTSSPQTVGLASTDG